MLKNWRHAFSRIKEISWDDTESLSKIPDLSDLESIRRLLDLIQARYCLIRPFFETKEYPLVEARELLPSFESDLYEYHDLPGFSQVILDRPLKYFDEQFQFDILHTPDDTLDPAWKRDVCYLHDCIQEGNTETILARLPRPAQAEFKETFEEEDFTDIRTYPRMLPFILQMDRGHVMARNFDGQFYLAGIFASLPSDLDMELKRFGLRIKKFSPGDNLLYERNRNFVYQFLMELYGYPIASERRTSAALFARRLHKIGEHFIIRALGQSDRTITSLFSHPKAGAYPRIQKLALIKAENADSDTIKKLKDQGFFVSVRKKALLLKITYTQHKYNAGNVRQDRALSVVSQEVIHPLTAESLIINILRDTYSMTLQLNDIVRGEFSGRTKFKRNEIVENTETHEKRLKFLYTWLSKHQRRIIGYSDDFYSEVTKVLDGYLRNPDFADEFNEIRELHQEVWARYSYIRQARNIQKLSDLASRNIRGQTINYQEMLAGICEIVGDLKFEIVNYFDELVVHMMREMEKVLADPYLRGRYILSVEEKLTDYGLEVRKLYQRLVALCDEIRAIRKARAVSSGAPRSNRIALADSSESNTR